MQAAIAGDLPYLIKQFGKYTNSQKEMIIEGIDLLEDSVTHGHEYVDQKYRPRIEELYS